MAAVVVHNAAAAVDGLPVQAVGAEGVVEAAVVFTGHVGKEVGGGLGVGPAERNGGT